MLYSYNQMSIQGEDLKDQKFYVHCTMHAESTFTRLLKNMLAKQKVCMYACIWHVLWPYTVCNGTVMQVHALLVKLGDYTTFLILQLFFHCKTLLLSMSLNSHEIIWLTSILLRIKESICERQCFKYFQVDLHMPSSLFKPTKSRMLLS